MKKLIAILLIIIPSLLQGQKNPNYRIIVEMNGFPGDSCILAHHYGDKKYVNDTVPVKKNKCIFQGTDTLKGGVYLIVLPPKNVYFEFIVSEHDKFFTLKTDTSDFIKNMEVKNSIENKVFYDYVKFTAEIGKRIKQLQERLSNAKSKKDSIKIQEEIRKEEEKILNYRKAIYQKYPNLLWTKILKMMDEPKVPDEIKDKQPEAYYYFKSHYLDYIDFSDDRLIRTPIFWNKITFYLDKLTPQVPDSVIKSVEEILSRAKANKEMLKFLMIKLLNKYATSKIMGMDAVYVYIVRNYYQKGYAEWADSVQLFKIIDRANKMEPNLIGKIGADIILPDSTGKYHSLHSLKNKYIILYIWDPDCGHCKKATPKLKKLYDEMKKDGIDVEVFAVYGGVETDKWKDFIKKHNLNWINVHDAKFESDYRWKYDVYSTPTIYLLDKNKKIIAKRLGVEQLVDFIRHLEKQEENN